MFTSIYSIVDMDMGQYHGPEGTELFMVSVEEDS